MRHTLSQKVLLLLLLPPSPPFSPTNHTLRTLSGSCLVGAWLGKEEKEKEVEEEVEVDEGQAEARAENARKLTEEVKYCELWRVVGM